MKPTETTVDIGALQPHPRNYNQHPPAQLERIAASLRQFGQVRPIVVCRDTIIAGHGVYQAAQHLGYTSLRVTQQRARIASLDLFIQALSKKRGR